MIWMVRVARGRRSDLVVTVVLLPHLVLSLGARLQSRVFARPIGAELQSGLSVYTDSDINGLVVALKRLEFLGDSLERLRDFPEAARKEAGVQLHKIQLGLEATDWKPVTTVGQGVREIRIRDEAGAFRVLYVVKVEDAVYVLHAFHKKTQQTAKRDLDLASGRLRQI